MKKEVYIGAIIIAGFAFFSVPFGTYAAVGISPAAAEHTLVVGTQSEHELSFMRDPEDTKTTMRVTIAASDAFIIDEGVSYMMYPGDREIKIPYRIDTEGYTAGAYTGYIYVEPERVEDVPVTGNAVKIRGGVRIGLTIAEDTDPVPQKKWSDIFTANLIQNLQIATSFLQK